MSKISNKSVFDEQEISAKYDRERNLVVIEMLYYGYFGEGNNVNWVWLKEHGLIGEQYPTAIRLSKKQFIQILSEGKVDVQNAIIN
jgi:hypothetical protein